MSTMPPSAGVLSAVVCWLAFQIPDASRGQEKLVVPVNESPFAAELTEITADWQLLFAAADEVHTIAVDDLVYWGAYRDRADRQQILLRDGSLLVAEITSISGGALRMKSAIMRQQEIPLEAVLAVNLSPKRDSADRLRQIQQLRVAGKREGQVWLANGDEMPGMLTRLGNPAARSENDPAGKTAEVTTGNQVVGLPVELIVAAKFGGSAGNLRDSAAKAVIGFVDGSLLHVTRCQTGDEAITFHTVSGVAFDCTNGFAPPRAAITLIQSRSSRLVYLSDLEPVRASNAPMLDAKFELQADRSVIGAPLRCRDNTFLKGLGMHAASNVVYTVDEKYTRFSAEVAIDESSGDGGSVIFRVFLLGADNQWAAAFTSEIIRGGQAPVPVSVELGKSKAIALAIDQSERGDVLDRANWLNARFEK